MASSQVLFLCGIRIMKNTFESDLKSDAATIESYLEQWLNALETRTPAAPPRLLQAVRHGVLGGGKRMRAFLVMETARLFGVEDALNAAAAVELIHCYSLVHDDLPCMDNDTLRRGLPTVHVAFDEATALLAGNVMLTHAFELLLPLSLDGRGRSVAEGEGEKINSPSSGTSYHLLPEGEGRYYALIQTLIAGAGLNGMLGGQQWDLAAEGRFAEHAPQSLQNEAGVITIQSMKTGALIKAAVKMGAILGNANAAQMQALEIYADNLGLAFQISDDLLDVTGNAEQVGKAVGKDISAGKATFVTLYGVEGAQQKLADVIARGSAALQVLHMNVDALQGAIEAMRGRVK